ncbi:DUF5675 family protein [Marisediminitalea sp.]|uniref:DUF5675 family protein n=1 Tax=Marisediminitalea sp. TaxID=2662268 RepID=UPI003512C70E
MLDLVRTYYGDRTEGRIYLPDGSLIYTLELPDLQNQVNVSCIPEGVYILDRDHTGRHRYYRFREVPGRTDIEIHPASRTSQLLGCIAPCMKILDKVAIRSEAACDKLIELFGENSWSLRITHELV